MHKPEVLAARMKKLAVEISLSNGSNLAGKMHVPADARLTDVLNDERGFLPVECTDGSFLALAKQAIERITLPSVEAADCGGRDFDRRWIALTDTQHRPIYVNVEHAISLKRSTSERKRSTTSCTLIGFIGGESEALAVIETPRQILALLMAGKQQDIAVEGSETPPYPCEHENGTAVESNGQADVLSPARN
ncbi:MAG TPA: hypothetical protein VKR31_08500 [Rhizomicrobium sp.]|nr:hypothetical protein [Rhizomicrobium sp.]